MGQFNDLLGWKKWVKAPVIESAAQGNDTASCEKMNAKHSPFLYYDTKDHTWQYLPFGGSLNIKMTLLLYEKMNTKIHLSYIMIQKTISDKKTKNYVERFSKQPTSLSNCTAGNSTVYATCTAQDTDLLWANSWLQSHSRNSTKADQQLDFNILSPSQGHFKTSTKANYTGQFCSCLQ